MPAQQLLQSFRDRIALSNAFIASAHVVDASGNFLRSVDERIFMTESSFLRVFIAWEVFLETTFVHYVRGNASVSGVIPVCYASPIDESHANRMLIGTQKYVDWANPEIVRTLAKLFFDSGLPYEPVLSSLKSDLFDLKIARNSAAHVSSTTNAPLDALSTRKLRRPCSNMTVYNLMLATDPVIPGNTILKSYLDLLDAAAFQIVQ